jgi:hypothetical protein
MLAQQSSCQREKKIDKAELADGDLITLGATILRFAKVATKT